MTSEIFGNDQKFFNSPRVDNLDIPLPFTCVALCCFVEFASFSAKIQAEHIHPGSELCASPRDVACPCIRMFAPF